MANIDKNLDKDVEQLIKLWRLAYIAASKHRINRKIKEEFYYNDVEKTASEFSVQQTKTIQQTYNIPVSTKGSFAIIEQLLSFLTANKPFAHLIAAEQSTQEFVISLEKAYQCVWYESNVRDKLKDAIRDSLTTGNGYLLVRKSNFYNEATTNVIVEYLSWKHFFIDPESRKSDYSDAEFIIYADLIRKDKAEKIYDVKLDDAPSDPFGEMGADPFFANYLSFTGMDLGDKFKYVYIREFYQKKEINVYISENGDISTKKPDPITIPNPDKAQLGQQIQQLKQQLQELTASAMGDRAGSAQSSDGAAGANDPAMVQQGYQQASQLDQQDEQKSQQGEQLKQQLMQMMQQYAQMPNEVPAFHMILEGEEEDGKPKEVVAMQVIRNKKKRILRTLMLQSKKIEEEYLPCSEYPIIVFPFLHFLSPNRVFGLIHFIQDIVKAQNKYLADIMYDVSTNAHRKIILWEGTVLNEKDLEEKWSLPNAVIVLKPNPTLPDGGRPYVIEPSQINRSIQYMLSYFKEQTEYITGIFGVMQGDSSQAPGTFGATQSLQSFGAQRVKLYARNLEHPLEKLAYVIVSYLQAYCPRDKVLQYFDDKSNPQTIKIMDNTEDLEFKVRVDITSQLPTTRQMTQQMLTFITQTTGDPTLKSLLTQYLLKVCDIPEADELSQKLDIVQQMQQQVQQLEAQLKEQQGENKSLQNNLANSQASHKITQATAAAQQSIAVDAEKQKAKNAQEAMHNQPTQAAEQVLQTNPIETASNSYPPF